MNKLSNEELVLVKGGASLSKFVWGIIGGVVVFAIGVIDGYKPQCLYKRL